MATRRPLLFLGFCLAVWNFCAPHSNAHLQADSPPLYENTKEGLKQLLLDLRSEAKNGDTNNLKAHISKFEIPNCGAWLHKMYDSDKADSWMGQCDPAKLEESEKSMLELLVQISKREGEFAIRKVNDEPEAGHGMEWGWLQAIHHPLDIYFATWKPAMNPKDVNGDVFGYFMYIDGGFRWDTNIVIVKPSQISNAPFTLPVLIKRVAPVYPADASANHITGKVRLTFVVGKDGAVYNVVAHTGDGYSGDPTLIEAAKEAVSQWKYQPGTLKGEVISIENISAEIAFALPN
jgi:TonB family protein